MADDTEDNHLRDAWNQAVQEYEKATQKFLGASSHEDLKTKCDELMKADHGDLVIKSTQQVLNVAELAVNAVKFIPHCSAIFTALSYLVTTVDFYRKHFTPKKVLESLQDVEEGLRRVTRYMNLEDDGIKLDTDLQCSTMKIFAACVNICRIYTKVAKDSEHAIGVIKNLMKAAFRWDNQLSAQLKSIKRATDQEISNNIAAIRVSDITTNEKLTREQDWERLKRYLRPDDKEPYWKGMQATLSSKHIEGIGAWVFDLERVKSWTNHKDHPKSAALYISQEKGRGKSHLCSQIIDSLKESCKIQQQKRSASIGWYFLPGYQMENKGKDLQTRGGSKGILIHDALKAVVWQLVQSDKEFCNFVVKVMNSNAKAFSDPKAMWTAVFSNFSRKSKDDPQGKPQKVLYLVLDGFGKLDGGEEELIEKMVDDTRENRTRKVQFRLLLSGTEKFGCKGCKIEQGGTDYLSDAERFIDKGAQNRWHPADQEYRMFSRILRKLENNFRGDFRGDFRELQKCLQEVNQSNRADLRTLEEEGEGNMSCLIIQRHLEAMRSKLDRDEIAILKELVFSMTFWCLWPSLQQLDAYLSMQLKDRYKGDIEIKLRTKFAGLFSVEDGMVVAQPLSDLVEKKVEWMKDESLIHFDFNEGNMRTTRFLLKSIGTDTCRNRLDARYFFEYAAVYLPFHFSLYQDETAVAIGGLDGPKKEKLGEWLFQALMDQEIVGVWLPMGNIYEILAEEKWVEQISDISIFWRHEEVRTGFFEGAKGSAEQPFLRQYEALGENLDEEDKGSEKAIPKRVEPHWLLEASAKIDNSKRDLETSKQTWTADEKGGSDDEDEVEEESPEFEFSPEMMQEMKERIQLEVTAKVIKKMKKKTEVTAKVIKEMVERARELLNIKEGQSRYNSTHDLRIAETFLGVGDDKSLEQAEIRCKFIIDREPLNSKAWLCLSQVLEQQGKRGKQALQKFMNVRHIIQGPEFRKDHHDIWKKELNRFWSLCDTTDSVKEALTVCAELAVVFPDDPLPSTNALGIAQEWIMRQEKLDASFEILSMKRPKEGCSILTELFRSNAGSYDFHEKFHVAAQNRQGLVFETYKYAVEMEKPWEDVALLQDHYGIALYRSGRIQDALKAWKQSVDSFKKNGTRDDGSPMMCESLRPILERLGSAYCGVINTSKEPGSARQYMQKLEAEKVWIDDNHPMEVNYIALLLGRVYQLRHEYQKAIDSARKFASKAFDLLVDDKQDNDWKGYFYLAEFLTSLDDDDNAQAAWSLVASVLESERDYDWDLSCAGGCDKNWDASEDLEFDLYVCRDCPHIFFERDCYKRLQSNSLDHRSCSRNHKFLQVSTRRAEGMKRLKPGYVLVGRDEVWKDDWLEGLKRRYGIPDPKKGPKKRWVHRAVKAYHVQKWKRRRETRTAVRKIRNAVSKKALKSTLRRMIS